MAPPYFFYENIINSTENDNETSIVSITTTHILQNKDQLPHYQTHLERTLHAHLPLTPAIQDYI